MSKLKFVDINVSRCKSLTCDVCGKSIVFDDFDVQFYDFRDLVCHINYSFPSGFSDCNKELFLCSLACLNTSLLDVPFSCNISIPSNRKYFTINKIDGGLIK